MNDFKFPGKVNGHYIEEKVNQVRTFVGLKRKHP
jgi:hypothetical protein